MLFCSGAYTPMAHLTSTLCMEAALSQRGRSGLQLNGLETSVLGADIIREPDHPQISCRDAL